MGDERIGAALLGQFFWLVLALGLALGLGGSLRERLGLVRSALPWRVVAIAAAGFLLLSIGLDNALRWLAWREGGSLGAAPVHLPLRHWSPTVSALKSSHA